VVGCPWLARAIKQKDMFSETVFGEDKYSLEEIFLKQMEVCY